MDDPDAAGSTAVDLLRRLADRDDRVVGRAIGDDRRLAHEDPLIM
jgi:hypothetical protein